MAAATQPLLEQRARKGRLRRFGPTALQIGAAVAACTLWAGVASPGLKLLPGLDGLADDSISISLQSAVLGIDDGSNRPAEERARDAAAVLGLTYAESLLSPAAVRAGVAARADGFIVPGVVPLGEIIGGELAAASVAAEPEEAPVPALSTSSEPTPTPGAGDGLRPAGTKRVSPASDPSRAAGVPGRRSCFADHPVHVRGARLRARRRDVHGRRRRQLRAAADVLDRREGRGLPDLGRCRLVPPGRDVRRRSPSARQLQVQRGTGPAGVHDRSRTAGDRLRDFAAGTCRRGRPGLHSRRGRRLAPAGQLRRGSGKRRCLRGFGGDRLVHRRGHLHGRGRPGRQRRLRARPARAAVLHGLSRSRSSRPRHQRRLRSWRFGRRRH